MIKKLLDRTFWKFILVGIINTIVGTSVMFLCYNAFHLNYWVSSAMNYIIGSIVSYFLNKYFTFQNKQRSWKIVIKFILPLCIAVLWIQGVYTTITTADQLSLFIMGILTVILIVLPIVFTKLPAKNEDYYKITSE